MEVRTCEQPFRHFILSGVAPGELIAAARSSVPAADRPEWIRYANGLERKWAWEQYGAMPSAWQSLMLALRAPVIVAELSGLIGADLQAPDFVSRGGGLHLMFGGGVLGPHIDYALHPCGLERRANLILFLDSMHKGYCGGGLVLGLGDEAITLYPERGEAVVWECGDETYHAVELLHPKSPPRVTAAAYYLAEPRPGAVRRRALFLPPR